MQYENGLQFTPGDHVAVFPKNSETDVDKVCGRVSMSSDYYSANTPLVVRKADSAGKQHF